jgi:teichuronic acid biosynthesis glycosyltransferase TuaC
LPSRSEGIPNVLREAMACGRPFVATRVGGIPEIASGEAGRLVPAGDIVELASALESILDSPPVIDRDRVRRTNISWDESALRLTDVLMSVVTGPRAAAQMGVACAI